MTGYVALYGDPVAGNPTSRMHNDVFASLGIDMRYLDLRVAADDLSDAIGAARTLGFVGLNLTIPHKVAVTTLLDACDQSAGLIGAVNTVRREANGRLVGSNTDGQGCMAALRAAGIDPAGSVAVVLGAGGAARAVAVELVLAGADRLIVVNRDGARRDALVELLTRMGASVVGLPWVGEIEPPACDLIVHCTPIGMRGRSSMPPVRLAALAPGAVVCDLNPETRSTPFLRAARGLGLRTIDGLETLARQGALGFESWTGVRPPLDLMMRSLTSEVSG